MPNPAVAASLALAPAAISWWTGRRLRADDPALPELLLARQQRLSQVGVVATVGILLLATGHAAWALPALLLGLWIAAWPLRREIFGERLDLVAYLAWYARALVGSVGFWIALSFAPGLLIAVPDRWRPWAAAGTAALLLVWQAGQRAVFLACHDAVPLDRPDLNTRLDAIDRRSRARAPRIVRFAPPGAHFVNAFALPALGRGTVAFSRTLLELMTPDEIAAIYAHEMAHLEHFTPQRLQLMHAASIVLVLAGCVMPLVSQSVWVAAIFPLAVCVAMFLRVRHSQAEETASDRRAVELTGDAAALARALQKLHFHARMPRRWPHDMEKHATHPSLARRVKALAMLQQELDGCATPEDDAHATRATATAVAVRDDVFATARDAAASGALPAVLRGTTAGSYVVLAADRAFWFEGVPADTPRTLEALQARAPRISAIAYADLVELRVHASGSARVLVARERTGRLVRTAIVPDDFGAAQAALDLVDGSLASAVAGSSDWTVRLRVAAALVLVASVVVGLADVPTALAALVLLAVPTRAAAAATGAAMLLRLALALLHPATTDDVSLVAGALYGVLGAALVGYAIVRTRGAHHDADMANEGRRPLAMVTVLALVALAAVGIVGLTWRDGGMTALAGRGGLTALVVALGGTGAALLLAPVRGARIGGVALLLGTVGVAAAGITSARHLVGNVTWRDARAVAGTSRSVPSGAWRFEVSPSGRRYAIQRPVERGAQVADALADGWDYEMDAFGGSDPRSVRAIELVFLDDARVLTLTRRRNGLAVRVEPTFAGDDPLPRPMVALPPMLAPSLRVHRPSGRWAVIGTPLPLSSAADSADGTYDEDVGDEGAMLEEVLGKGVDTLVVARGRVGDPTVALQRWAVPGLARPLVPLADGSVLYTSLRFVDPRGTMSLSLLMMLGQGPRWELWRLDARGARQRLATVGGMPSCGQPDARDEVLCAAQDGALVRVWRVDAAGRVHDAGAVPVGPFGLTTIDDGRVAVWLADGRHLVVLDPARGRGQRVAIDLPGGVLSARAIPGGIVALRTDGDGLQVTELRLEQ